MWSEFCDVFAPMNEKYEIGYRFNNKYKDKEYIVIWSTALAEYMILDIKNSKVLAHAENQDQLKLAVDLFRNN